MTRIEQVNDLETTKQLLQLYARDNERLHKRIEDLLRRVAIAEGKEESEQLQLELAEAQEQLAEFRRKMFAASSEKRPSAKPQEESGKPRRGHGPRAQTELKVEEVVRELPEDDRACPKCGEQLEEMKGQTEDSELITNIAAEYWKLLVMRQKYRCRCNASIVTAPGPRRVIKGGRYTAAFATQVAVDKYVDHLPLERQVRSMKRAGLSIDSQTLWDQLDALAKHLQPTYDALRQYILGADVIGADETWWRLMKKKSNKKWYAWGLTTHDAAWYRLADSRLAAIAKEVLDGFDGTVLCDGYKAYETVETSRAGVRLAHCWAHARRKFVEAEPHYPKPCAEALDMIGKLFEIESALPDADGLEGDEKKAALEVRARQREHESRPLLDSLREWALQQQALPKSALRKAIEYMLRYWKGLTAFLDDPHLAIHNNRTERALRGMVIGRKNHYGSRSARGTEVAALFYSLVESAKLCGLDPGLYLRRAAAAAIDEPGATLVSQTDSIVSATSNRVANAVHLRAPAVRDRSWGNSTMTDDPARRRAWPTSSAREPPTARRLPVLKRVAIAAQ